MEENGTRIKNPKRVVETRNLTKVYDGFTAVDRLNLEVFEGEVFGFLGPNGAGKTTTLLMLLGLTEPTKGEARVCGVDPMTHPIEVKKKIGYLQENMGFYRDLNALESLRFITDLNGIEKDEAESRIQAALETVGLEKNAEKEVQLYSRGMRQRLGIAEILVKKPKVAFLDEPTLGLDPDTTNHIIEIIRELSRENRMTVLLSSHQLEQVQKICGRVGIMIDGKMVAQGPMERLAEEKLGVGREEYTLEQIYLKYFQEA